MQCSIVTGIKSRDIRRTIDSRVKIGLFLIIFVLCLFISGCSTNEGISLIGMKKCDLEELLRKTPDSALRVDILNELAYRESWNGGQKPLKFVDSAKNLAKKIKYREGLVDAYCMSGQIYFLRGEFDQSKDFSRKALGLAKVIHYERGKAMAYNSIARYHQARGEYDAALDSFLKSEEICKNSSDKISKRILAGTYYGLGALNYYDPQDYREALKYFEKHFKLGEEINDDIIKTSGYYTIGLMHQSLGRYKEAEENLMECRKLSNEIGLIYNQANAYEGLGDMWADMKDYGKAKENFEKSHELFLQTGDLLQIAEIKKRLGSIHIIIAGRGNDLKKNYYREANKYLQDALEIAQITLVPKTIEGILEEFLRFYEKLVNVRPASFYFELLQKNKEFLRKNEMSKQKFILDFERAAENERIKRTYLIMGLIGLSIALVVVLGFSLKLRKQKVKIETQATRLEDALIKEKELSNHKDDLMNTVYHQYKTPLANIDSSVQVLKEYSSKLSRQEIENQFNKILSNLGRMARLIDQLSMFGKRCNPADYDLDTICRAIIEEIKSSEGGKHTIEFDSSGYCGKVKVDKDILEIMLQNLVNNAIKFSPEGSKIRVELLCDAGYVEIKVSDSGIGIPEDYLKLPFERFHRGSNVGAIPGTGLGLSIVKRYTDLHGGEISIDSRLNVGTTVTIKIPKNTNGNKGDHNE